jgi:SPP1 gp7 family putative phage head morphogenesis protein
MHKDPTRTKGIRTRWIKDARRRYRRLAKVIRESIVDRDALGLQGINNAEKFVDNVYDAALKSWLAAVDKTQPIKVDGVLTWVDNAEQPTQPKQFARLDDQGKIDGFMGWLKQQEDETVLEIINVPGQLDAEPWTNTYIRSSYTQSIVQANIDVRRKLSDYPLTKDETNVMQSFANPVHAGRVKTIYATTWEGMNGVTAQMNTQINQVLAQGLISGKPAVQLAKDINDRVNKIGLTRAELIARTETAYAHNVAAVAEHEEVEAVTGLTVYEEWLATLDNRTRTNHAARHGKVFKHEDALELVGEPNCRCGLIAYMPEIDGATDLSKASQFI